MIILRGKHKGRSASLHQCSNDWISVDVALPDGGSKAEILNPMSAEYDADEIATMQQHAAGFFWSEYEITGEGPYRLIRARRR